MSYENNNERNNESIYSQRLKAGKKRTYFFDVRSTKGSDYFITLTESKKRFEDGGYDRHKIFIYKEDFNKFLKALTETVEHVRTELMPDYDFEAFNHDYPETEDSSKYAPTVNMQEVEVQELNTTDTTKPEDDSQTNFDLGNIEVDKW